MKKFYFSLLLIISAIIPLIAQQNMSLLGHLTYSNDIASLWGWTDGNGHEYALVGAYSGLSIVDITNPATPVEVQFVSTQNSFWHEVKTWDHYAYVVNESGGGLLIVDLASLPGPVTHVNWTGGSLNLNTGHSLWIDENGIAYINGSNVGVGGVVFLDLKNDPMNPIHIGTYTNGYVHDCYARNDTMWTAQIYSGQFKVVNVSNKASSVVLASQNTPGSFTHNTALSDNGKYLFTTDEKTNSYVTAYDVSDLSNITEVDRFQANPGTKSIGHNVHVKGNFLVIAYYRDGVVIADASDPSNLIKVGNYDTSPFSGSGYNGCWEAYADLPSGNIIAADIEQGLFVLDVNYVPACLLQGTVTDYTTGAPLIGVSVSITGAINSSTTSDLSGKYKTGYSDPGTFSVQFSKTGYLTKTISGVSFTNGVTTLLNTTLKNSSLTPCVVPGNLFADNIGDNSATLHWSDEYAKSYTITLKNVKSAATQTLTSNINFLDVANLVSCTDYKFKVKAKCTSGGSTVYSPFKSFTTTGTGCGKLTSELSEENSHVQIYPNPFTDKFYVKYPGLKSTPLTIKLFDVSGKLIYESTLPVEEGESSILTDSLEKGMYLCRIQVGSQLFVQKLLKME